MVCFESKEFCVVDFLNQTFPDVLSLANAEVVLEELNLKIEQVDKQIELTLSALESNHNANLNELDSLNNVLLQQLITIKSNSIVTAQHINEACREIKQLDTAKTNLTSNVTTLKRLILLITALENLRLTAVQRDYKTASELILACSSLIEHLNPNKNVDGVKNVVNQYYTILTDLRCQLIEDYDTLFDLDSEVCPQLITAHAVVNSLPALQEEIKEKFINALTDKYKKSFPIFQMFHTPLGGLTDFDRRFTWLKKNLREFSGTYGAFFPHDWDMSYALSVKYCNIVREQLVSILSIVNADEETLISSLSKLKDFEEYLEEVVGNERKREKMKHASFIGIISESYGPYLSSWVVKQEKAFVQCVHREHDSLTTSPLANDTIVVFSSAVALLSNMKKSLEYALSLNIKQTLDDLFLVARRVLNEYVIVLGGKMKSDNPSMETLLGICGTAEFLICTIPRIESAFKRPNKSSPHQNLEDFNERISELKALVLKSIVYRLELSVLSKSTDDFENWSTSLIDELRTNLHLMNKKVSSMVIRTILEILMTNLAPKVSECLLAEHNKRVDCKNSCIPYFKDSLLNLQAFFNEPSRIYAIQIRRMFDCTVINALVTSCPQN